MLKRLAAVAALLAATPAVTRMRHWANGMRLSSHTWKIVKEPTAARTAQTSRRGVTIPVVVATIALLGTITFAFAEDVDWKVYGGGGLGPPSVCFFDAKSVSQTDEGHVRAWTKCLPEKELDKIDVNSDRGREITKKAGFKMFEAYTPPS